MDHPPYSSNLMPGDFRLYGHLKKHLVGKHFATYADMKQAVAFWLQTSDSDSLHAGKEASETWWENAEMSMVMMWKSDVYHLLVMHYRVRITFSAPECLLRPLLKTHLNKSIPSEYFFLWHNSPRETYATSLLRFLYHTHLDTHTQ
jgi:hypothetical protein